MRRNKTPKVSEKQQPSMVRSLAAEYLTFIVAVSNSDAPV